MSSKGGIMAIRMYSPYSNGGSGKIRSLVLRIEIAGYFGTCLGIGTNVIVFRATKPRVKKLTEILTKNEIEAMNLEGYHLSEHAHNDPELTKTDCATITAQTIFATRTSANA